MIGEQPLLVSSLFQSELVRRSRVTAARWVYTIARLHVSPFSICRCTGHRSVVLWHTVHPLLVAVARPRVRFTRIVTLTTKSTAPARRYPPAARKASLLTIDRIRDPPTVPDLKRHADHSSMRSTAKRVSFTPSTPRHSATSSTNCPYSQTAIGASDCHPRPASSSQPS
jgi:hypothetical protein